jgi:7,8-dihydropterin-6-yl-methyl-4-(beta-D-ribofuranosyl)aminobenzene 5'-phosphate synthase
MPVVRFAGAAVQEHHTFSRSRFGEVRACAVHGESRQWNLLALQVIEAIERNPTRQCQFGRLRCVLASEGTGLWREDIVRRRDVIGTALTVPSLLLTACASSSGAAANAASRAQTTVLYDAFGRDPAMQKDWGYTAFIEFGGKRILFDTGNNAQTLERNAKARATDLSRLDFVVMSHRHGDHMGGMSYLLARNPNVRIYAPKEGFGVYGSDLPSTFYRKDPALAPEECYYGGTPPEKMVFGSAWPQANITLVDKTTAIEPGIHLIALVSDKPGTLELRELSLALDTPDGMVIVVGCSHPGIDNIVKAAAAINPNIKFIAGGFHLVVAKDPEIDAIVTTLRDTYNVGYVAPGHCTGEPTFAALKRAFGDRYLYAGLGTTLALDPTPHAIDTSNRATSAGLGEEDVQGYRALFGASGERRRGVFARLPQSDSPEGTYLAMQWRQSMVGCC